MLWDLDGVAAWLRIRKPCPRRRLLFLSGVNILNDLNSKYPDVNQKGRAISEFAGPFLENISVLTIFNLKGNVAVWDISNPSLLSYLGYVAGVLDAADFVLRGEPETARTEVDEIAVDIAFYRHIKEKLFFLPKIEAYLMVEEIAIENRLSGNGGSGLIGNSEFDLNFFNATSLGATDFFNYLEGKKGSFPAGLFELGLVGGGGKEENGRDIGNGSSKGYSINPGFSKTAPDITKGKALKRFAFDGYRAVLFRDCPMSHREKLPWLMRLLSVKYKYVLAVCAENSNQFNLIVTHEKMFFNSVCMGGFSADSSHMNFGTVDKKISVELFVKKAFDEVRKLLKIQKLDYKEISK